MRETWSANAPLSRKSCRSAQAGKNSDLRLAIAQRTGHAGTYRDERLLRGYLRVSACPIATVLGHFGSGFQGWRGPSPEPLQGLCLNERTLYMRRSAWTMGVALLAALSLGVAACGGDDSGNEWRATLRPTGNANPTEGKQGGKLTVLWAGDVDYVDCGQAYYQASVHHLLRDPAPAVLVQARRRRQHGAGPRRGPARGVRGRQDRHGQDQHGRQVLAAGRPRGHVQGRQVRDRADVLLDRRDRLLLLLRGHRRRRGRRRSPARRSRASRRPTTRRSSSSSTRRPAA